MDIQKKSQVFLKQADKYSTLYPNESSPNLITTSSIIDGYGLNPTEVYRVLQYLAGNNFIKKMKCGFNGEITYFSIEASGRDWMNGYLDKTPTSQTFNLGTNYGAIAMGNSGGNYTLNNSNSFKQSVGASLTELIEVVDRQKAVDKNECEEIKELLRQLKLCIENSQPAPKGLFERLNNFMQKNSWFASPFASEAIKWLSKLIEYVG